MGIGCVKSTQDPSDHRMNGKLSHSMNRKEIYQDNDSPELIMPGSTGESDGNRDLDQVYPGIWVGGQRAAQDKERLKKIGIKHILNTATQLPNYHKDSFVYLKIDLLDAVHERIISHFPTGVDFIKLAVDS